MKKLSITTIVVAIMFMVLLPVALSAENQLKVHRTEVRKQPTPSAGNQEVETDNEGNRAPSRPLACTISLNAGITIHGCSDEIETFEIWDIDGYSCITAETDEMEFVNAIFSYNNDCQIRLKIANSAYSYVGYIIM